MKTTRTITKLDIAKRNEECAQALERATASALTHIYGFKKSEGIVVAASVLNRLNVEGFRVSYIRVNRNGRGKHGPRPTPEQIRRVKALRRKYPDMHQEEIGRRVGIKGGRVSEILGGMRG